MIYRGVKMDNNDKRKIRSDRLKAVLIVVAVLGVIAAVVFGMRMLGIG